MVVLVYLHIALCLHLQPLLRDVFLSPRLVSLCKKWCHTFVLSVSYSPRLCKPQFVPAPSHLASLCTCLCLLCHVCPSLCQRIIQPLFGNHHVPFHRVFPQNRFRLLPGLGSLPFLAWTPLALALCHAPYD